ncbi:MAG: hypothetical protein AAGC46_17665 [Solirubrobacteraceae bacterium]|nr:hypothetical protein [Patulibacter sp.]
MRSAGRDRHRIELQPAVVGARDDEEIVGEAHEPLGLVGRGTQRAQVVGGCPAGSQREFELRPQDRERRAELVAGIGHERALPGRGLLEPREHRVERAPEAADLVGRRRDLEPTARRGPTDRLGLTAHPVDGSQRGRREPVAGE